jgi:hypothetical protein
MAITTAMCNSFKQELLGGVHDLDTDSLRVALIKASPTEAYGANTTTYDGTSTGAGTSLTQGTNDEAVGTNYTATGQVLDSATISLSNGVAIVDFADEIFANLTIAADGALIYNDSKANRAIAVFNFGATVTSTSGNFTVVFPGGSSPNNTNAVIRIS